MSTNSISASRNTATAQGYVPAGLGTTAGNPVFNNIQPTNPSVIPSPNLQQIQIIQKALQMLNNHQLLMKFATDNKQSIPAARLYWEKVATEQLT